MEFGTRRAQEMDAAIWETVRQSSEVLMGLVIPGQENSWESLF